MISTQDRKKPTVNQKQIDRGYPLQDSKFARRISTCEHGRVGRLRVGSFVVRIDVPAR